MGIKINNYSQIDTNIQALQLTTDAQRTGYCAMSLTEYATSARPSIAAGSEIEIAGALYQFDTDETISTTDPMTGAQVVDGTVYIILIPDGASVSAAFTATAPTWDTTKQGWYGTSTHANKRYAPFGMTKSGTDYTSKYTYEKYNTANKIHADGKINPPSISGRITKFDEVVLLTGSGFTDTGLGFWSVGVNFPSGFTNNNSVVLSCMVGEGGYWCSLGHEGPGLYVIFSQLRYYTNGVFTIMCTGAVSTNSQYRVLLARIS